MRFGGLAKLAALLVVVVAAGYFLLLPREGGSKNTVRLGAVLPLSGDVASYGKAAQKGIDLAIDEINAKSGTGQPKLSVTYEDSRGQTNDAISAMRHLIATISPPVVFGEAPSSATVAIAPIANENQVVLFSPISSTEELTQKGGPFFFRMAPSDGVQAVEMANWVSEEKHKKVAIIYVTNSWGDSLRQVFQPAFVSRGGEVVAVEGIAEGTRDLRTVLAKVRASGADALYAITYGKEGGALLRQAKDLGLTMQIYGADVWGSPELLSSAGASARGAKIIVPAAFQGPLYESFAKRFQARYGEQPDIYAAYSYDMVYVTFRALAIAPRGIPLRDAIRATHYDGVTGATSFDGHGNVVGKQFTRRTLTGETANPWTP